jgi:hypothetical protein
MRVQRTRVLLPAVARRSPLTRRPLGSLGAAASLVLAGVIWGCASSRQPVAILGPSELGVSEAIVRAILPQPVYPVENPRPRHCVTFVRILGADPPSGFFSDTRDIPCRLKPGSEFVQAHSDGLISIEKISWTSGEAAVVDGSTHVDQYLNHGWQFDVTKVDGEWVASNPRLRWTS